ncbi:hypothetical protein JW698_00795 [Candidatus Wolfebacteria bacterium]|nr:hypothetical protein [Candidatus Wolfebacteria bacterium]
MLSEKELNKNSEISTSKKIKKIGRWVFLLLVIGGLIILTIGGFYLYQYFTSRDVIFSLRGSVSETLLGVPFNVEADIKNNSSNPIKEVKLSMVLPEGAVFVGENVEKNILNLSFGDLEANTSLQEKIPVVIFENEQAIKNFEVVISYFPPSLGPKARFEQKKSFEVKTRESGIELDLVAPQKVLNNEEFEIEIQYQNISNIDFSGVELELEYPEVFTFKEATVKPSKGNNVWEIGDLIKNSQKGSLIIKGYVLSGEKSFFEIKGILSIKISGRKLVLGEKNTIINIAPSPLSLSILLNNQLDYVVSTGENLNYKIAYRNNSETGLNDIVIKAKLSGEMFDFASLKTTGFFNSATNIITWNVANTPELRFLNSGVENYVDFEIKTKKDYPIKRVSDKDFNLKIDAEISSPTVPYYVDSDKTVNLAELNAKVVGKIVIESNAFFYDLSSGFINKGSFPPKVNMPTNFTIHWIIANYSTDVKEVGIRAFLQSGVKWTGQVKSNTETVPTYNERTQEIVWNIDRIPATKGVVSAPIEAIFQIEVTPNITQLNRLIPLLSETFLSAVDEFTGLKLESLAPALNSGQNAIQ